MFASQAEQVAEFAAAEKKPAGQGEHTEPPPESTLPAAQLHWSAAPVRPLDVKPAAQLQEADPALGATAFASTDAQGVQEAAVDEVEKLPAAQAVQASEAPEPDTSEPAEQTQFGATPPTQDHTFVEGFFASVAVGPEKPVAHT